MQSASSRAGEDRDGADSVITHVPMVLADSDDELPEGRSSVRRRNDLRHREDAQTSFFAGPRSFGPDIDPIAFAINCAARAAGHPDDHSMSGRKAPPTEEPLEGETCEVEEEADFDPPDQDHSAKLVLKLQRHRLRRLRGARGGQNNCIDTEDDVVPTSFVIAITTSKLRRLHFAWNCGRRPGEHYRSFEVFADTAPEPIRYDKRCRQCFPEDSKFHDVVKAGRMESTLR